MPFKSDEIIEYLIKVDNQFVKGQSTMHRKWNDRSIGGITQPMLFVNAASINPKAKALVVPKGAQSSIDVEVLAHKDLENVGLNVKLPEGWSLDQSLENFDLKNGQRKVFSLTLSPSESAIEGAVEF